MLRSQASHYVVTATIVHQICAEEVMMLDAGTCFTTYIIFIAHNLHMIWVTLIARCYLNLS